MDFIPSIFLLCKPCSEKSCVGDFAMSIEMGIFVFKVYNVQQSNRMKYTKIIAKNNIAAEYGIREKQYIYMEKVYNHDANAFMATAHEMLKGNFDRRGMELVYLPKVAEEISGQEYLDYIVPTGERTTAFATADVFEMLLGGMEGLPYNPFLLRCSNEGGEPVFEMWEFENCDGNSMFFELHRLSLGISHSSANEECPLSLDYEFQQECFETPFSFDAEADADDDSGILFRQCDEPAVAAEEEKTLRTMFRKIRPADEEDSGIRFRRKFDFSESQTKEKRKAKKGSNKFGSFFGTFAEWVDTKLHCDDGEPEFAGGCMEDEVKYESIPATLPIKVQWETNVKNIGADALFNEVMTSDAYVEATNKIYEGIKQLHKLGIGSLVIRSIAGEKNLLSRIHIDDEYNITLPDYNNMVIEMAPMTKAIYLLFLRYDEGIMFKELPDYRNELTALYWDMIESDDEENVKATVARVTDPFSNAINEHCSRIKAAFTLKFENALASNYYIYGKRGEPKRISLPRELVEWC